MTGIAELIELERIIDDGAAYLDFASFAGLKLASANSRFMPSRSAIPTSTFRRSDSSAVSAALS